MASSGSRLGSTPNSKLFDVLGPAAEGALPPSSSGILALRSAESIGDEIRASESKCDPGCTVRRCLKNDQLMNMNINKRLDERIITARHMLHKRLQDCLAIRLCFFYPISVAYNINSHIVLL